MCNYIYIRQVNSSMANKAEIKHKRKQYKWTVVPESKIGCASPETYKLKGSEKKYNLSSKDICKKKIMMPLIYWRSKNKTKFKISDTISQWGHTVQSNDWNWEKLCKIRNELMYFEAHLKIYWNDLMQIFMFY